MKLYHSWKTVINGTEECVRCRLLRQARKRERKGGMGWWYVWARKRWERTRRLPMCVPVEGVANEHV